MKRAVSIVVCSLGLCSAIAACGSDDDDRPGGIAGTAGSGGSSAAGGAGGVGASGGSAGIDGGGGSAGSAASGGSAGTAGSAGAGAMGGSGGSGGSGGTPGVCGDGSTNGSEACDGADLDGNDCSTVGFQIGTLACTAACQFDTTGCSGTEQCYDGKDNDGDGTLDCFDSDCTTACASSCSGMPTLSDPSSVTGNTKGHVNQSDPSCSRPGFPSGPEVIYAFVPAKTGVLDLKLTTAEALNVSVRTSCDDPQTELGCKAGKRLRVPITAGTPLFVVVDGVEAKDSGLYLLEVESRTIACGDGHRDGNEGCDDANKTSGDGCSSTCSVESSESEPNGTIGTADALVSPFFAAITPASDLDVIAVTLAAGQTTITADTFDFGDGACGWDELDSEIELLSAGGNVLASDDDGGAGLCAHLVKSGLAAGTYYLRVSSASTDIPTFPYRLGVSIQ